MGRDGEDQLDLFGGGDDRDDASVAPRASSTPTWAKSAVKGRLGWASLDVAAADLAKKHKATIALDRAYEELLAAKDKGANTDNLLTMLHKFDAVAHLVREPRLVLPRSILDEFAQHRRLRFLFPQVAALFHKIYRGEHQADAHGKEQIPEDRKHEHGC